MSVLDMVDGGWTVWSSWSKCSVTCDYGAATRSRSCTNPAPRHGGADCVGTSQGYQICKDVDCPSKNPFLLRIPQVPNNYLIRTE